MAQSAGQSDVEATLSRIQSHKGVLGTVIVSSQGVPLRSTLDEALTKQYAELIPSLSDLARNLVRDLDPQNDLEFLRIRSFKHEIMVAARDEFVLIVIQDPTAAMTQ
ncbi:roadblock/lc7 family protein [Haematococcus lacustris]